jgi:neutral ceramidase
MTRHALALSLGLALAPAAVAQGPTWKAGFGTANITPETFMWMSGYGGRTAPADGKETDLWAKAAVLQAPDGGKLVLVTLDLVGIDRGTSLAARRLIEEKHKLPREAVILSTSHTHCGPVVGTNLRTMYFFDAEQAKLVDGYAAKLPTRILKAVDAAAADLGPVTLASGVGTATFAVNRRNNREADVPALRAKGELKGPVDHDVPVLAACDAKGKLRGVIFGYACHATVMSYQKWSGDYPGFAMIELEKAHPGAVAMFWAGCGADQNPLPRRTVALAKGYGKQLAAAVDAALAKPMTPVAPAARASYKEIDLSLAEVPSREAFVKESMGDNKFAAARAKMFLQKIAAGGKIPDSYPYPVQAWRLGKDLTLVALGGEVVVDYSLRLKKELGSGLWVMAYANDVMAYIPSARVLKEGGYEGGGAMVIYGLPSVWGPKVEELIVGEVARQVKQVRGK